MKRNVYINKTTDEALSKLGGANRAENLRRAVALAECADELAEALESIKKIAEYPPQDKLILSKATEALTNYRSAKQ